MPLWNEIYGYYEKSKNFLSKKIEAGWNSYYGQAAWQGFGAPVYSFQSVKTFWDADFTGDLRTNLTRAFKLNAVYAAQAFSLYVIYYRLLSPALNQRSNWNLDPHQWSLSGIDTSLFLMMHAILFRKKIRSVAQNFGFTSNLVFTATKTMLPSDDFKPCECDESKKTRAEGDSLFLYAGVRFVSNSLSATIEANFPGVFGNTCSFFLEAATFGYFLLEYKLSAVGRCTIHRYKELLTNNKWYCLMFGASFVAATRLPYNMLNKITNAENPYLYDAMFSYLFQLYVLISISRKDAFPGHKQKRLDFVEMLKKVLNKKVVKSFLKWYLAELVDIEEMVKTPAVSLWIAIRGKDITGAINTLKDKLDAFKYFQTSYLFSLAEWFMIPADVKEMIRYKGHSYINSMISEVERLVELANLVEEKEQQIAAGQTLTLPKKDYFVLKPHHEDDDYVKIPDLNKVESLKKLYSRYYEELIQEEVNKHDERQKIKKTLIIPHELEVPIMNQINEPLSGSELKKEDTIQPAEQKKITILSDNYFSNVNIKKKKIEKDPLLFSAAYTNFFQKDLQDHKKTNPATLAATSLLSSLTLKK